jgi:hypothetical protein
MNDTCPECMQSLVSLELAHRVECGRCHRNSCKTPACSASILEPQTLGENRIDASAGSTDTGSGFESVHICQPCYRDWCDATKMNTGEAACRHLETTTGQQYAYVPQPPNGFCVFACLLPGFLPDIPHPTNPAAGGTMATAKLLCQYILHRMTCTTSPWWEILRDQYPDFTEGMPH